MKREDPAAVSAEPRQRATLNEKDLAAMPIEALAELREKLDKERIALMADAWLVKQVHASKLKLASTIDKLSSIKADDFEKLLAQAAKDPDSMRTLVEQARKKRDEIRVKVNKTELSASIAPASSAK